MFDAYHAAPLIPERQTTGSSGIRASGGMIMHEQRVPWISAKAGSRTGLGGRCTHSVMGG